jgi:integrase
VCVRSVFAHPNGGPIDKKTDYDEWTRLLRLAGVRHVRLHDGRHTAATLLLSENVHPRVAHDHVTLEWTAGAQEAGQARHAQPGSSSCPTATR